MKTDDQISRQATLEALLDKGQHSRRYKLGDIWELNFDEIREVINALPAADPHWIPCSERLPMPGEYYLVTRQFFGWNCTEYREIDIAKYDFDGWHTKATKVLAWCELPKPWEGGQNA